MNGFKCIMAKRSKQVEDHKAIKQHSEKRMKMKVLLRIRGCHKTLETTLKLFRLR